MARMNPTRRKLAIATWGPPTSGTIFGKLTLDVTQALKYIDEKRETSGQKITITHLIGKAAGEALHRAPTLNGRILWGSFIPFETVDVTFLVAIEGGDLSKVKVERCEDKSVEVIAGELKQRAKKIRGGEDKQWEKSKGAMRILPTQVLRPLLWLTGWLSGSLGVSIPALGVEKFAFGSCVITSVGMLGLDEGFAPFTPFCRVPLLLLVGAIREQPTVVDGELAIRKMVTITATVDHRFVDGAQLGVLASEFRRALNDPWSLDDGAPLVEIEADPADGGSPPVEIEDDSADAGEDAPQVGAEA